MISHGKQLPAWVDSTMMATIEHLAIKRIKAVLGTGQGDGGTELLHMAMGRLLQGDDASLQAADSVPSL